MNDDFRNLMIGKLFEKMDIDAFAEEMAPAVSKAMKKGIIDAINDIDWDDFVYELIQSSTLTGAIQKHIVAKFKSAL